MRVLAALIVFSGNCLSQELPSQFTTAKSFADLVRAGLVNKIAQMDQNFIRTAGGNEVGYHHTEEVSCLNGVKASPRQKLLKISYASSFLDGHYQETRFYYGCSNTLGFRESYSINGVKGPVHDRSEILAGKMDFESVSKSDDFSYELADGNGSPLVEIIHRKHTDRSAMVFKIGGAKVLRRQVKLLDPKKIVRYFAYPYEFSVSRNGSHFNAKSDGAFENYVTAIIDADNISYYGPSKERLSMAAFQALLQPPPMNLIMDMLLAELPETKFISSNAQSSKMLEELRNAQTFLISGVQLKLVRNLIEEYIKAVQEGSIVDNRK